MDANTLEHASKHHSSSSGHSTVLSSVHHSTGFTFAAPTPVNTLNFATPKPPPSPKSQRTARKLQGYHPVQLLNHLPELSYGHLKMNLVSIYAPNTLCERKLFFQNLHEFFFTGSELIIGGDFNCVDSNQDKYGGNVDTGFVGRQELAKLKSDFYLTDI